MAMSLSQLILKILRHGQSFLVYPSAFLAHPRDIIQPSELGLKYKDLELKTSDGVTLKCFFLRQAEQSPNDIAAFYSSGTPLPPPFAPQAKATVIMFHGNGMNLGDAVEGAREFILQGCNVLMLSYRGYGNSGGVPSERGI